MGTKINLEIYALCHDETPRVSEVSAGPDWAHMKYCLEA